MLRVWILAVLIYVHCGMLPSVASKTVSVNGKSMAPMQNSVTTADTNAVIKNSDDEVIDSDGSSDERYYHPAEDNKPQVLEEFSRHFLDGSYEYKYILSNGVTRYEKAFWKSMGNHKRLLARKGFYSHPLPNGKFLTVFYTADEHGYQQDTAKYTNAAPTLPKHLDVTQLEFSHETMSTTAPATPPPPRPTTTTTASRPHKPTTTRRTTTRKPKTTTTQRPITKPSKINWVY